MFGSRLPHITHLKQGGPVQHELNTITWRIIQEVVKSGLKSMNTYKYLHVRKEL